MENITELLEVLQAEGFQVVTPQFDATTEKKLKYVPKHAATFYQIVNEAPREILIMLGFGLWDIEDGVETLLFPSDWYDVIPEGFEVFGISGKPKKFIKGVSDDDRRHGCLPYGIKRKLES